MLPCPSSAPSQRAFTLVEVLLVAFLLGVGALGLGALQVRNLRCSQENAHRLRALALAQGALEAALAQAPEGEAGPRILDHRIFDSQGRPSDSSNPFFQVRVQASAGVGGAPGTRTLRATVAWLEPGPGRGTRPRSLALVRHAPL